jgi:hypothetical protein
MITGIKVKLVLLENDRLVRVEGGLPAIEHHQQLILYVQLKVLRIPDTVRLFHLNLQRHRIGTAFNIYHSTFNITGQASSVVGMTHLWYHPPALRSVPQDNYAGKSKTRFYLVFRKPMLAERWAVTN